MPVESYKIKLGKLGEQLAAQFLFDHGCKIIDKNFYTRYGEIDLIAQLKDEILFCEVKTRTNVDFGYPERAVDDRKLNHLFKAANIYLQRQKINNYWRLDVLAVTLNVGQRTAAIRWFKNVGINSDAK